MAWTKSPAALIERFESVAPGGPEGQERKMFGYPACFVGGNMFMSLFEDSFAVRLPPVDRDALAVLGGTAFAPMPERPMREYLVLPRAIIEDDAALREWTGKAYAYGASLPAKASKPRISRA